MKISIFCAGAVRGDGVDNRLGGCGVVIVATDEHGRGQYREFSYGLGGSSLLLAEVQAVRLALSSVVPSLRQSEVALFVESRGVAELVATSVAANEYVDQVAEMRRWKGFYGNLSVNLFAGVDHRMQLAKDLAVTGMTTQKNSDSLTRQS